MAEDLSTYLNKAIYQYTPDLTALIPDFKEIEKLVFTGDGLVTGVESTILSQLTKSPVPVLLSDTDQKRMKIITGGGFTLNRYYSLLAKEGLEPANYKNKLNKISQQPQPIKDYEYDLTNIEINKDNLSLTLTSPEGINHSIKVPLHLTEEGIIHFGDQISPLTFSDVLSSLGRYLAKPLNENTQTQVTTVYRNWMEEYVKYQSKLMRESGHKAQQELSTIEWLLACKNMNWSEEQLPQIDTIFFGDKPDISQTRALKQGWEKIPAYIRTLIKQEGYEIHLVGDETLKQLADTNPQINISPLFAGITDPLSKRIYLLRDQDIAFLTYAVVHECGHAFHDILSSKMGGKNCMGSAYDEVLAHHFALKTRGENYEAAPTVYGSTNQNEWFAEMFALTLLSGDDDVLAGIEEHSVGYKYLMERATKRDPLGVNLVGEILGRATHAEPAECVLNWRDYTKYETLFKGWHLVEQIDKVDQTLDPLLNGLATFSLSKGDGISGLLNFGLRLASDQIADFFYETLKTQANEYYQFIQRSPCDPLDNDYRFLNSTFVTTEADRKKEIIKLYNANRNYYPFKKDGYASILTGYLNPTDVKGIKANNPTLENAFTWIEAALTQSPEDPVLHQTIAMMFSQENETPNIKNFETRLLKLAQTVYEANPENPDAKTICALSLSRRGQYDKALGYLTQVKEFYQKSQIALNLTATEPALLKTLDQGVQWISSQEAKIKYLKGDIAQAITLLKSLKNDQGDYLYAADLANIYYKVGEWDKVLDLTEQQNVNFDGLDFDTLEWLNQEDPLKYGSKFFVRWNALHPKKQTPKSIH